MAQALREIDQQLSTSSTTQSFIGSFAANPQPATPTVRVEAAAPQTVAPQTAVKQPTSATQINSPTPTRPSHRQRPPPNRAKPSGMLGRLFCCCSF
ncbi:MAG: hypothetical protein HC804_03755 [Anaerolineae bacterium]|nr:hypothetical protein [Anaerolineae bacterium]